MRPRGIRGHDSGLSARLDIRHGCGQIPWIRIGGVRVYPLQHIRNRMEVHRPQAPEPGSNIRQAAVAVILRERERVAEVPETEVLFIRRAEKPGDPWSGHMAFPGGHREPDDPDLRTAAARETLEEIGVDLADAPYLGQLDHQPAAPRGRSIHMIVSPHVFELTSPVEFRPNHEVAEVVWAPLTPLMKGVLHAAQRFPVGGESTWFNGYRLTEGHFVWGLTYRMLKQFFSVIDPHWVPPKEL
jgi:8-oxo-dGTP pyrophosphatase MutT (NUDIX family)